jgi:hypothetical protein
LIELPWIGARARSRVARAGGIASIKIDGRTRAAGQAFGFPIITRYGELMLHVRAGDIDAVER